MWERFEAYERNQSNKGSFLNQDFDAIFNAESNINVQKIISRGRVFTTKKKNL